MLKKYGNAIRSKPIILKAITDINSGNWALKIKLKRISSIYKIETSSEVIPKSLPIDSFTQSRAIIKNGMIPIRIA
jgi:hypothetical protein